MKNTDTIAAISTPAGVGGIAVIRVSGSEAINIVDKIFVAKQTLAETETHKAVFGQIVNRQSSIVNPIDEVLVTIFRNPHSFTGEDTVEISAHGSLYIQQEILKLLLDNGARLAQAGEFTQRAFLNGKMDLSQAEAVADLIASTSAAAHSMAINQMRGGFSAELKTLREQLLEFVSLVELELDFSEEDVEFADREKLKALSKNIETRIAQLANSFQVGNALKNGIPVALVGETNVGKSTLLNLLLNEEKAIVSDIHGTTRDVIEDTVNIQGITFRFIDTAGIRKTDDKIENLGIERSFQQIEKAAIVLWLVDGTSVSEHIEWLTEKILKRAEDKKVILIFNKIDKISSEELEILNELFAPFDCEKIEISAKKKVNTEKLQKALLNAVHACHCGESRNPLFNGIAEGVIVSNARHYEALKNALAAIQKVNDGLENNLSGDLLSQDIRETMHYLGEITGEISTDEVLGNIFARFCIGK
ncbi:MAG: tRNA uridine-5-carboxymethylaminomethyl(34) synthesis GTPase MnmE [Prevotellaceae bacterium]|jgi:tRNA modification GTPase|nr:tRNA uridine-5-carboxymethylaminomethyl(34) synthesis GTPase MnmE [Prevotellaceae bacterium]